MDAQLGQVLNVLDKNNLWDKTLVIFVGDHGYPRVNGLGWNKNTLFERSCRAPLIIAHRAFQAAEQIGPSLSLSISTPQSPTCADSKIPHEVAGTSLRTVLKSPDAGTKDAAFTLVTRGPKLLRQSVTHIPLATYKMERRSNRALRPRPGPRRAS